MRPQNSPTEQMLGLLSGYWLSQALYVFAELRLADLLAAGPRNVEYLAEETHCNADSLYRFLRAQASIGLLQETTGRQFELTALSQTLRSDHPDSLRPVALLGGHPAHWQAWGNLLHSVRTGQTAFDAVHHKSFFELLEDEKDLSATFQSVMRRLHEIDRSIAETVDLQVFPRIVDLGGGTGSLAREVARRNPASSVIVFDRSNVVASAEASDHIEFIAGDFLKTVPAGDAYLLKFVLHDWNDARAVQILKNCASATKKDGRVFVIEVVLPDDATPSVAKTHDVNMLVLTGGRERKLEEYRSLFDQARLEWVRSTLTPQGVSVLEARRRD